MLVYLMQKRRKFIRFLEWAGQKTGCELVGWSVRRGGEWFIRLTYDHPEVMTIERCARLYTMISRHPFFQKLFSPSYRLEISSPGIRRELKTPREFRWALGKIVDVKVQHTEGEIETARGQLLSAHSKGLRIRPLQGGENDSRQYTWAHIVTVHTAG